MLDRESQTIIAQCTPSGKGALALIRISGPKSREIVANFSKPSKNLLTGNSHTIHYGHVIDIKTQSVIDNVLFLIMDSPRTFTGQDTVEITCHNNPFIIENIISQAINCGARIAQPGEFTERAFLNGKIDLLQAESINDLISANTQSSLKKSLAQLNGSFSKWISSIEEKLIRAMAWSEASFEFLEEAEKSNEANFEEQIQIQILDIIKDISRAKGQFDIQQQLREGIRIALIGSVNTGKSSLFNALLGQNRAIVTNIAGTTRDTIEAGLYKNGNYWTLIDTAGLRKADDIIEQEGIERSFDEAKRSDIILLVYDSSRDLSIEELNIYNSIKENYNNKIICAYNKSDLTNKPKENSHIFVCATLKENISALETEIQNKIDLLLEQVDSPFLLNKRQFNLLLGLENLLEDILNLLVTSNQPEIISYHLKYCLEYLSELTGKSISEAVMDKVFKEFCVGK